MITHDKVLGEGERFYTELNQRGISVRVGLEATGYSRWFERLPAELWNKCNIQENVF